MNLFLVYVNVWHWSRYYSATSDTIRLSLWRQPSACGNFAIRWTRLCVADKAILTHCTRSVTTGTWWSHVCGIPWHQTWNWLYQASVSVRSQRCTHLNSSLSSVCVHPTQLVEIFGNVSKSFGTLAIHWHHVKFYVDRPGVTPQLRGLNPRLVAKYINFGPIKGYISETVQDRR